MDLSRGDEVFEIPFITWKVYTWIFGGSIPWRTYFFGGGGEEIPNQIHWASVGFNWWMTQKYFFFTWIYLVVMKSLKLRSLLGKDRRLSSILVGELSN